MIAEADQAEGCHGTADCAAQQTVNDGRARSLRATALQAGRDGGNDPSVGTVYICNGDRVTVSSVVSNSDRLVAYRGDRSVNEGRHDA